MSPRIATWLGSAIVHGLLLVLAIAFGGAGGDDHAGPPGRVTVDLVQAPPTAATPQDLAASRPQPQPLVSAASPTQPVEREAMPPARTMPQPAPARPAVRSAEPAPAKPPPAEPRREPEPPPVRPRPPRADRTEPPAEPEPAPQPVRAPSSLDAQLSERQTRASEQASVRGIGLSASEIASLRAQVSRCWQPPAGIINRPAGPVRLRLALSRDGFLSMPPQIIGGPGDTQGDVLAESATRAVIRCQPFVLPEQKFATWRDMILVFDPTSLSGG